MRITTHPASRLILTTCLSMLLGCATLAPRVMGGPTETADCDEESSLRGTNGRDENSIIFHNDLQEPVKGYWLGYDGKRKLLFTLEPGQEHMERTYVTQPWVITDNSDRCLFTVPNRSPADGVIRISTR